MGSHCRGYEPRPPAHEAIRDVRWTKRFIKADEQGSQRSHDGTLVEAYKNSHYFIIPRII